ALYVAVTNRDLVGVIDTRSDTVTHLVSVARPQGLGTAPTNVAISPDEGTLYASDAGEDAVAAISLSQRPSAKKLKRHKRSVAPSVKKIRRFRAGQVAAAHQLSKVHGSGRAAAKRRYNRQVQKLTRRFLRARISKTCGGATKRQEKAYVKRVLKA